MLMIVTRLSWPKEGNCKRLLSRAQNPTLHRTVMANVCYHDRDRRRKFQSRELHDSRVTGGETPGLTVSEPTVPFAQEEEKGLAKTTRRFVHARPGKKNRSKKWSISKRTRAHYYELELERIRVMKLEVAARREEAERKRREKKLAEEKKRIAESMRAIRVDPREQGRWSVHRPPPTQTSQIKRGMFASLRNTSSQPSRPDVETLGRSLDGGVHQRFNVHRRGQNLPVCSDWRGHVWSSFGLEPPSGEPRHHLYRKCNVCGLYQSNN